MASALSGPALEPRGLSLSTAPFRPPAGVYQLGRATVRLVLVMLALAPLAVLSWYTWKWSQLNDDERMDSANELLDELDRKQREGRSAPPHP